MAQVARHSSSARPRSAWCMISASPTPIAVSRVTAVTVKNVVLEKAFQKASPRSPLNSAV